MRHPERAIAPGAVEQSFGLMRIGAALLALPVAMLREVIPCPLDLPALPVSADGLCGAVQLRGTVIPVLDLRVALGLPLSAQDERVIVLMRYEGRLLGLLANAVHGMVKITGNCLHALSAAAPGRAQLATFSFELGDGIASVLDAARIAALPGVPMVAEPRIDIGDRALRQREPLLLFNCGAVPFGVASMSVDATVPRTVFRDSSLKGGLCLGVIDHHGYEVPVVDTLQLLGFGQAEDPVESAVIVLRFAKGYLGLVIDQVRDIVQVAEDDVLPIPAIGLRDPQLFRGMLGIGNGEQHMLLDAQALQAQPMLSSLASLSRPLKSKTVQAVGAQAASAGTPYLTYQIGVETASLLTQINEIIPFPSDAVNLPDQRDATIGLFIHRGAAVPLVCLTTLLGRSVVLDPERARVLIVEHHALDQPTQRIGLVVESLCSIENSRWEQALKAGQESVTVTQIYRAQPLIEVGINDQRRTLPRLDIEALVRALFVQSPTLPASQFEEPIDALMESPQSIAFEEHN